MNATRTSSAMQNKGSSEKKASAGGKTIRDIMTGRPELVTPDTTLTEAARKMRDGDFGFLPVGENDRLQGVVTDRDIAVRAVAEGQDPESATCGDVMTQRVLYCFQDDTVQQVAGNMGQQQVRRLIVLDNPQNKRMVGVVSLGDVACHARNEQMTGHATEEISQQTHHEPGYRQTVPA